MATLFAGVWNGAAETLVGEPIQEFAVTITGTSAQTVALTSHSNEVLRQVRVFSDTDCFVTWGSDPTATNDGTSGRPLGAENPEVFGISSGAKLAVIART